MNLALNWNGPTPTPTNGFKILYRTKSTASYTEFDTSGSTSGNTVAIPVTTFTSYEGTIQGNCGNGSLSEGVPWGTNAYLPLTVSITQTNNKYNVSVTSRYGNPYSILLSGSFTDSNHVGSILFNNVIYPSGSTSAVIPTGIVSYSGTISNLVISAVNPLFDNGGQIQQLDTLLTPSYFQPYWSGNTSGATWSGAPFDLPSFTIDGFDITEVDVNGNTTAGTILVSYILDHLAITQFTQYTYDVYDPGNNLLGSLITLTTPLGLRQDAIQIVRVNAGYPLKSTTQFTIKMYYPNGTLIDSKQFYLPLGY